MEPSGERLKDTSKSKEEKRRRHRSGRNIDIIVSGCFVSSQPDPPDPSKKDGDQVLWSVAQDDKGTYAIIFDPANSVRPSPFKQDVFIVKPQGKTPSGRITLNDNDIPSSGLDFKYRLVGDNGCDEDPIIHIGP